MNALTDTRWFWIALAAAVYPLLFATLLVIVIMPPLNMIGVPIWFLLAAGAVGNISNGLDAATRRRSQRDARRKAPGVEPVQRTNALWNEL
jgi:hypothetical protein